MKRIAVLVAAMILCIALAPTSASAAETACHAPRCFDITVPLPSDVYVSEPVARVFLPQRYDPQRAQGYPVVYLLHGATEDHRSWTSNVDLDMVSAGKSVIYVMPAGGGTTAPHGWYSDWVTGAEQWETFHTKVLPAYIDDRFNTAPRLRSIAGVSSGGFGAMSYAARNPGTYAGAASLSGLTDIWMNRVGANLLYATDAVADGVWGNPNLPSGETAWRAHNPTDLAGSLKGTDIFLTSGEVEVESGFSIGTCDGGPALYPWCDAETHAGLSRARFATQLESSGVSFQQWVLDGAEHDWPSWELAARWAIPKLLEALEV